MNRTRWIVQVRRAEHVPPKKWITINVPTSDRATAYDILRVQRKLLGKKNVRIKKAGPTDLEIVMGQARAK